MLSAMKKVKPFSYIPSIYLNLFYLGLDSSLLFHDICNLLGFALYHPFETWFLQPPVVIPTASSTSVTATITTATPAVPCTGIATDAKEEGSGQERRPSWRLRVDNGDRSKVCPVVCACTCCLNVHLVASRSCH